MKKQRFGYQQVLVLHILDMMHSKIKYNYSKTLFIMKSIQSTNDLCLDLLGEFHLQTFLLTNLLTHFDVRLSSQ